MLINDKIKEVIGQEGYQMGHESSDQKEQYILIDVSICVP